MEDLEPGIKITVEGESDSGKTLVCNIINQALNSSGFTNTTIVDNSGEPVPSYEAQTYLDLARQTRPELFDMPIRILEVTTVDMDTDSSDDDGESTDIPDEQIAFVESLAVIEAHEAAHY